MTLAGCGVRAPGEHAPPCHAHVRLEQAAPRRRAPRPPRLVPHPQLVHHLAGDAVHLLQVVLRAGDGAMAKDQLLGRAARQPLHDQRLQVAAPVEVAIIRGREVGDAHGLPAGLDGRLVQPVLGRADAHERVAGLVVRHRGALRVQRAKALALLAQRHRRARRPVRSTARNGRPGVRAALMAASFTRLASSAPVEPGVQAPPQAAQVHLFSRAGAGPRATRGCCSPGPRR